jgi:hypothetical protein
VLKGKDDAEEPLYTTIAAKEKKRRCHNKEEVKKEEAVVLTLALLFISLPTPLSLHLVLCRLPLERIHQMTNRRSHQSGQGHRKIRPAYPVERARFDVSNLMREEATTVGLIFEIYERSIYKSGWPSLPSQSHTLTHSYTHIHTHISTQVIYNSHAAGKSMRESVCV